MRLTLEKLNQILSKAGATDAVRGDILFELQVLPDDKLNSLLEAVEADPEFSAFFLKNYADKLAARRAHNNQAWQEIADYEKQYFDKLTA